MAQVKANSPIVHNGVRYEEGDVVGDLTAAQARQLIDSGSASKDTEGSTPSRGKAVPKSDTSAASNIVKGNSPARKTVSEKAQEREQADQAAKDAAANGGTPAGEGSDSTTPPAPVELPSSFTTDAGEFSTKLNSKGAVSAYQLNGETIKKADYAAAFEASQGSGE